MGFFEILAAGIALGAAFENLRGKLNILIARRKK